MRASNPRACLALGVFVLAAGLPVVGMPVERESVSQSLETLREREVANDRSDQRIARARESLYAARRALDEARVPGEDDWMTVQGAEGRGPRRVPSPAYLSRVESLEANVRRAEIELERAQRDAP